MYNILLENLLHSQNKKDLEKLLKFFLNNNGYITTNEILQEIPKYFYNFILENLNDGTIKNISTLKFYIINELNLLITNDYILFNIVFNNQYHKINNNFEIIEA